MNQNKAHIREIILAWRSLTELASYAIERHGFGNSDGGFGVTYPEDLDEYERTVENTVIPEGFVQIYGYWGEPDGYEYLVAETLYLSVLSESLREAGLSDEVESIQRLLSGDS